MVIRKGSIVIAVMYPLYSQGELQLLAMMLVWGVSRPTGLIWSPGTRVLGGSSLRLLA